MPDLLSQFLDPARPSLKICGVTRADDAEELAALGVAALGVNFWPQSKRYCPPDTAAEFLATLRGRILRVGVFVNSEPELPMQLIAEDLIDLVQFHGDETPAHCKEFAARGVPFVKALASDLPGALDLAPAYRARAILLDAHAPGVYGGTGQIIDWALARNFVDHNASLPVILAGGITPANAADALQAVRPAALDVASGAESTPGIKDFAKVRALLTACRNPGR